MKDPRTYAEKLRDPRWQKKRLEIMQRDGFQCTSCGDDSTTLNVHHSVYQKGAMPWEYEDHFLTTLCELCHANVETYKLDVLVWMGGNLDLWNELHNLLLEARGDIVALVACTEMLHDPEWVNLFFKQGCERRKQARMKTPTHA